jgi:hypothetical protein
MGRRFAPDPENKGVSQQARATEETQRGAATAGICGSVSRVFCSRRLFKAGLRGQSGRDRRSARGRTGTSKGRPKRGIYSLENEYLRVCVNKDRDQLPTEFSTKSGDGLRILVFKRQRH